MKTGIQITAEQLVREALHAYKTDHADPDVLIGKTIARLYPNADGVTVRAIALTNSVTEGIAKLERQAAASESEFYLAGQMSLLGEIIPEHKVPKGLMSKPASEMDDWMRDRAAIERENAQELRRAADAQERKAKRFEHWSEVVHRVCVILNENGINPAEVSYAEALKKAEAVSPGHGSVFGTPAERPMR